MDCDLCGIRSSVGYCAACRRLVCEVCAGVCVDCGRIACREHGHETRHGHFLCPSCLQRRRKAKKAQKQREDELPDESAPADDTSFDASEQAGPDQPPRPKRDSDDEGAILAASARRAAPWQRSLALVAVGSLISLLLLTSPFFRVILQPWGSCVVALLAGVAAYIAAVGLPRTQTPGARTLTALALVSAFVVLVLAVMAVWKEVSQ